MPNCTYCKHDRKECDIYRNIRNSFKSVKCEDAKSIKINCKKFEPKAVQGDLIQFEMNGELITRPVFYPSNDKTFFVLTSNNQRNKDIFTRYTYGYNGDEFVKTYYSDEKRCDINDNLMLGIVNYKFIRKVVKKVKIPNMDKNVNPSTFNIRSCIERFI